MNIFVTGATGFIGSYFVNNAKKAGHNILALKRRGSSARIPVEEKIQWIHKDFDQVTPGDFSNIDVLVHLAASGVTPQPATWDECFSFNVIKTLNLFKIAISAGVKKFVITGSYAEYGRSGLNYDLIPANAPLEPTDIYAASKACSGTALSTLAQIENVSMTYLRLFSVFGEGQYKDNFWPSLKHAAFTGKDFKMTKGEQIRDFIEVEKVADSLLATCQNENQRSGILFFENLASGNPQSLREFAEFWWRKWNAKGKIIFGALPYRDNEVMRYVPLIKQVKNGDSC